VPEDARAWVERTSAYHTKQHESSLAEANKGAERWEAMYNAISLGDEDPRIAQGVQDLAMRNAAYDGVVAENKRLSSAMAEMNEESSTRYMSDFSKKYEGVMAKNPEAVQASVGLMNDFEDAERFFEPHQALEIALLGERAVATAGELFQKGWKVEAIEEVIAARFKGAAPTEAPPATPKPRPAAAIVGGGGPAPARRPAAPAPRPKVTGAALLEPANKKAILEKVLRDFGR